MLFQIDIKRLFDRKKQKKRLRVILFYIDIKNYNILYYYKENV